MCPRRGLSTSLPSPPHGRHEKHQLSPHFLPVGPWSHTLPLLISPSPYTHNTRFDKALQEHLSSVGGRFTVIIMAKVTTDTRKSTSSFPLPCILPTHVPTACSPPKPPTTAQESLHQAHVGGGDRVSAMLCLCEFFFVSPLSFLSCLYR